MVPVTPDRDPKESVGASRCERAEHLGLLIDDRELECLAGAHFGCRLPSRRTLIFKGNKDRALGYLKSTIRVSL